MNTISPPVPRRQDAPRPRVPLSREREAELAALAQAGDIDARDQLVESNLPLVSLVVARDFGGRTWGNLDFDDLAQAGAIGLMRATMLWRPARGVRFSTYAGAAIRSHVGRLLINERFLVRVPAYLWRRGFTSHYVPASGLTSGAADRDRTGDRETEWSYDRLVHLVAMLPKADRAALRWYARPRHRRRGSASFQRDRIARAERLIDWLREQAWEGAGDE